MVRAPRGVIGNLGLSCIPRNRHDSWQKEAENVLRDRKGGAGPDSDDSEDGYFHYLLII